MKFKPRSAKSPDFVVQTFKKGEFKLDEDTTITIKKDD